MYDLLLKVAPRECHGAHMPIQTQHTSRCGRRELETANMNVGYTQQGTPMKGIQRLIVLDRCPSVTIADIPQVWSCGERKVRGATHSGITGCVVPLVTGPNRYVLLWGAGSEDEGSSGTDDEGYSETPLASAYRLLDKQFQRELSFQGGGAPHAGTDEWLTGGVMQKLAGSMNRRCEAAVRAARDDIALKLELSRPILYVYDFCACTTAFDDLEFVNDAARPPLNATYNDDEFKAAYGVARKLSFTRRVPRARTPCDWWAAAY